MLVLQLKVWQLLNLLRPKREQLPKVIDSNRLEKRQHHGRVQALLRQPLRQPGASRDLAGPGGHPGSHRRRGRLPELPHRTLRTLALRRRTQRGR